MTENFRKICDGLKKARHLVPKYFGHKFFGDWFKIGFQFGPGQQENIFLDLVQIVSDRSKVSCQFGLVQNNLDVVLVLYNIHYSITGYGVSSPRIQN